MALGAGNAFQLEDDNDPKREALRRDNLRGAYEREHAGYLLKAEHADDDNARDRYLKRATGVVEAAKADGVPIATAGRR